MVDLFMLLLLPGGGDELQGIKKGIVELADLIVVNKADGALINAARHAVAEYRHALASLRSPSKDWKVPVLTCSAATRLGIPEIWGNHRPLPRGTLSASGALDTRRAEQARAWMWSEIAETLDDAFRHHPAVRADLAAAEHAVTHAETTPTVAARPRIFVEVARPNPGSGTGRPSNSVFYTKFAGTQVRPDHQAMFPATSPVDTMGARRPRAYWGKLPFTNQDALR